MKILIISDVQSPILYEHFNKKQFEDVDLILSAGDLKADYMSFITTALCKPLLYIHGNHDGNYKDQPPLGCICIEDSIYEYKGLRIAGIGGSMWYNGDDHQFSEKDMAKRVRSNWWTFRKGFDILLTHSPAFGIGDGEDLPHTGFKSFNKLLDKHKPQLMIHGHQHLNYKNTKRQLHYNDTKVINAYGHFIIEV